MIIRSVTFNGSAAGINQYPQDGLPEIILAGRSNVGKSSFINTLLNNHKVARVSSTPGKTRLINFFRINGSFYFVDLPGYGYANVTKTQEDGFQELIETYFQTSLAIRMALLLVDVRRVPSEDDLIMYHYFQQTGVPVLLIATKADKVSNNERINNIRTIRSTFTLPEHVQILPISSLNKTGIDAIWQAIEQILNAHTED